MVTRERSEKKKKRNTLLNRRGTHDHLPIAGMLSTGLSERFVRKCGAKDDKIIDRWVS